MKNTYRIIPVYTGDVSGVCSALYELGGMVVIHDPSGCNSTYNTHDETRWYDTDSLIYISGLSERDAVLGNDDKFLRDVVAAANELHPSFLALTNSPIPFMNGTDFKALAAVIEKRTNIPTFYVRANAMHDYTVGAGNAFLKLADYMTAPAAIADKKMSAKCEHGISRDDLKQVEYSHVSVNVLGLTPLDFDAPGSVETLHDLLREHGFFVNVSLGMQRKEGEGESSAMGARESDWKRAPKADVNLVVSSTGFALAKKMEELFLIPYVVGMPTGAFIEPLFTALIRAAHDKKSVIAYDTSDTAKKAGHLILCGEEAKKTGHLILIGEAVTMGSLAAAIRMQYGIRTTVICPLETWQGLLREGDFHTEGEEDLEALLKELFLGDEQTAVIADPLYRPILPDGVKFFSLSHEAFSGRCFFRQRKSLIGAHAEALESGFVGDI